MNTSARIYVAGHTGMVGKALMRRLALAGYTNIVTATHAELDLCDATAVSSFLRAHKPDVVLVAAAKVGGIHANKTYPAEFIYDNLAIATNLIHAAHQLGVARLIFLGSTCIYPRMAPQPIQESALLSGPLEQTNEAYAIAKIAGLKLCQHYRAQYGDLFHSVMPTNMYGPGDNYNPMNAHVLPALMRRFHEACENGEKQVTVWGSGSPKREFLHVDDCADGVIHLMHVDDPPDWVNIGMGADLTIRELTSMIAAVTGYQGEIVYDTSKPDGTPRKLCDSSLLRSLGWQPRIDLQTGLEMTYQAFCEELEQGHLRE
jgi:GDP-L-fucose synthase